VCDAGETAMNCGTDCMVTAGCNQNLVCEPGIDTDPFCFDCLLCNMNAVCDEPFEPLFGCVDCPPMPP
jgi:hypothetical protein